MRDNGERFQSYAKVPFSGRQESVTQFQKLVLALLPQKDILRILDLGCGTGDLIFGLSRDRPNLSLTGIDISSVNIQAAKRRAASNPLGTNIAFFESDYYQLHSAPFDVIIADSVLHLLVGNDEQLASKLAFDLAPGGLLIATMPHDCLANRALIAQRRLWRAMPPIADTIAAAIGRLIHAKEPPHIIGERVRYLRIVPERLHNSEFAAQMKSAGLDLLKDSPWPRESILKLKHRLLVFKRTL
jgi:trans-aconitate 2-methyltransferase